jgi:hypothetical protein
VNGMILRDAGSGTALVLIALSEVDLRAFASRNVSLGRVTSVWMRAFRVLQHGASPNGLKERIKIAARIVIPAATSTMFAA